MHQEATATIIDRVSTAAARRGPTLAARRLDAWRVVNGAGDGAPAGLTLDRYGAWLVLSARAAVPDAVAEAWARGALEALAAEGLVLKRLAPEVSKSSSRVYAGQLPKTPLPIHEDGAVLLCDLDDGVSTGLFLDHHDTRPRVRPWARGVEVLNLFAYTGAFSVHAALGGATRVTSVDVGKRALRRGRENMRVSGLDPDLHRWFADDVFEHLARLRRRAPSYGLVIADPPVFGRARGGRAFALDQALGTLLEGCMAATLPGGRVVFSTHAVELSEEELEAAVRGAAARLARPVEILERLGLPEWDHPVLPGRTGPGEADRGDYLKTLVLRVG